MATKSFPRTLQEAVIYFSDPDTCLAELVKWRWQGSPVSCPTCGSERVHFIATRRVWECAEKHPLRQFSIKVGTIMEDSAIKLDKWLLAMWLIPNAKNGISSYELARAIGVTQKSAWFMLHRIRLAMQDEDGGKLSGVVEVDETYNGGKDRNMHPAKRDRVISDKRGGWAGKMAVLGMLERTSEIRPSKVRLRIVKTSRRSELIPHIEQNVERLTRVYTDALPSYEKMPVEFFHEMIDHANKYVEGQVHTNGLENFWSLLKRTIRGTYVSVEPFHLFRYLDEQAFRFNNRKLTDAARFALTAAAIFGKRLTFTTLTGLDQPQTC
jgi:transposase-like protein